MEATRHLAIIGTAGRDRKNPLDGLLWQKMLKDIRTRVKLEDVLVSGGAAWADHLAVKMYLEDRVTGLILYLPAPLELKKFRGGFASSGSAATYYHELFSKASGTSGIAELHIAIRKGAFVHEQPNHADYSGMFARNKLVAKKATACVAYTFGDTELADGGTKNTWDQIKSLDKTHVSLRSL